MRTGLKMRQRWLLLQHLAGLRIMAKTMLTAGLMRGRRGFLWRIKPGPWAYTHAMAGINKGEIESQLDLADDEDIICAVAIGVAELEGAQAEEISPRKSLDQILTMI